jgi:hypothetical protein
VGDLGGISLTGGVEGVQLAFAEGKIKERSQRMIHQAPTGEVKKLIRNLRTSKATLQLILCKSRKASCWLIDSRECRSQFVSPLSHPPMLSKSALPFLLLRGQDCVHSFSFFSPPPRSPPPPATPACLPSAPVLAAEGAPKLSSCTGAGAGADAGAG